MSNPFQQQQKLTKKTPKKVAIGRAADEKAVSNATITNNRAAPSGKEPAILNNYVEDSVVNLEGRTKGFMYIPVTLFSADQTWKRVVGAIREMDSSDFNEVPDDGDEKSYDCYSLKYMYDSFVLARTRLVRLEEEDNQLYIELRKLEGDGFAFTDDFQMHLETQLADITKPDERPEPQPKPEPSYLDLSDPVLCQEVFSNWFTNLRPKGSGNVLVYNDIETYKAMSSLAWNATSPENFEILKDHGEEIIDCSLNILNATSHLPTAYFAALTLNEFATNNQFVADWSQVKIMSGAIVNWSEESGGEFAKMQVRRSREVVRLLSSTLLAIGPNCGPDGRKHAEGNMKAMLEKLRELSNSEDYKGMIDVEATIEALSM